MPIIKKIISPILYAVFLVPVFIGIIAVIATIENTVGYLFDMNGFVELPILILILGTALFWLANRLMTGLEKLLTPNNLDHLRQSSLYYTIALCALVSLIRSGYHGGLEEAYMLMFFVISVWAIIINATFLYKQRKKKHSLT